MRTFTHPQRPAHSTSCLIWYDPPSANQARSCSPKGQPLTVLMDSCLLLWKRLQLCWANSASWFGPKVLRGGAWLAAVVENRLACLSRKKKGDQHSLLLPINPNMAAAVKYWYVVMQHIRPRALGVMGGCQPFPVCPYGVSCGT